MIAAVVVVMIIGMAVFHGHHIDGGFTTPFYKMMLGKTITLDDIESVDFNLHSSLSWVLNNNVEGIIDNTFSVDQEVYGTIQTTELKKGGKDIPVSRDSIKSPCCPELHRLLP